MTRGSVVTPGPESFPVRMLGFTATVSPFSMMLLNPPMRSTASSIIRWISSASGEALPFTIDTFAMVIDTTRPS